MMTKKKFMKSVYWVIGIIFAIIVLMAGFHFWNNGQSTPTGNTSNPNSSSATGSGSNNHNPAQEIQKHLKQMGI